MTEQELDLLYGLIEDVLIGHGIEPPNLRAITGEIIAAIEWEFVIVSDEEWADVRRVRETIEELHGIVREWTA